MKTLVVLKNFRVKTVIYLYPTNFSGRMSYTSRTSYVNLPTVQKKDTF